MLLNLPTDVIQMTMDFLPERDRCCVRSVCSEFTNIHIVGKWLYAHVENNMSIIRTQSWLYRLYLSEASRLGFQCRTCGRICMTELELKQHYTEKNHSLSSKHLSVEWKNNHIHVRTLEDLQCMNEQCCCPSKQWTLEYMYTKLRNEEVCLCVYTKNSVVIILKNVLMGIISDRETHNTYYTIPYIYINFLNIYEHHDHLWLSFYHSYDEVLHNKVLHIPVYKIEFVQPWYLGKEIYS